MDADDVERWGRTTSFEHIKFCREAGHFEGPLGLVADLTRRQGQQVDPPWHGPESRRFSRPRYTPGWCLPQNAFGRYLPQGYLVYVHGGTLFAAPFNLERLEITGTPVPAVEGVSVSASGGAEIAFSAAGTLMYFPAQVTSGESAYPRRASYG